MKRYRLTPQHINTTCNQTHYTFMFINASTAQITKRKLLSLKTFRFLHWIFYCRSVVYSMYTNMHRSMQFAWFLIKIVDNMQNSFQLVSYWWLCCRRRRLLEIHYTNTNNIRFRWSDSTVCQTEDNDECKIRYRYAYA